MRRLSNLAVVVIIAALVYACTPTSVVVDDSPAVIFLNDGTTAHIHVKTGNIHYGLDKNGVNR